MKKLTKIIIAGLISTSALSAFADSSANSASAAAPKSFALKVRGGYANNSLKEKPLVIDEGSRYEDKYFR